MTKNIKQIVMFLLVFIAAISCVIYFGNKKAGFHEDEYYSYYSTNYVHGWVMPDSEWVPQRRYFEEFVVLEGQQFQYELVKTVQSWDVHPPMYYWVLHTVCSVFPGRFSKWMGLSVNIIFYAISLLILYLITRRIFQGEKQSYLPLLVTACYAFSPAAISSVMFIRMYTLLTCLILISCYLHVRAWQEKKLTHPVFLVLMAVLVYVGFLTQYYFMIYHFFLSFAICIVMLVQSRSLKKPFIYGICAVIPFGFAYITYPACLGQMFRGQRGAQATNSFFELSNTWERFCVFIGLTDEFLFQGMLPFILILLIISIGGLICKRRRVEKNITDDIILLGVMAFTVLGYLLVVSKTALLLGDSSVRYVLPIFGILLLVIVWMIVKILEKIGNRRYVAMTLICMLTIILFGNGYRILKADILFLFPEGSQKVTYAREHAEVPTVYIYNDKNSWCIWESSNELFEYPEVYFISDGTEAEIVDEKVQESKELLVYVNTIGDVQKQIQRMLSSNEKITDYELVHESKFCNLYHFY